MHQDAPWDGFALEAHENRFRLLVQSVVDYAIFMLDPGGRVASWNPGAERFKGYTETEIIGQHFSRFYSEADQAAHVPERALREAERVGRFEMEGWRIRKDGSRFWAHVVIDAIRDPCGKLLGFAKITRDITQKHEAEQALARAQAALLQSQKMEALGQLTGGVAHDFNNLLTAVLGNLALLRKRVPDDPTVLRLLDNAIQGAQRGATLTQRMLAFARRQDLKMEAVNLQDLVCGISQLLQASVGPGIKIQMQFPEDLPHATGDANQLELALLNLVMNARDAMPEGGQLLIGARTDSTGDLASLGPGRYVCLAVTDTGTGMDEPTLTRATEPFFTTKDVGRGTGLGLSMVHGIAEQSGGRLVLRSHEGSGTTAEIWLRVAETDVLTNSGYQESARPTAS